MHTLRLKNVGSAGSLVRSRMIPRIAMAALCCAAPYAQAYDWLQFNGDPQHSGNNTQETSLGIGNVANLTLRYHATLPASSDGSPVFLDGVTTAAGVKDLLFVTTKAGDVVALNAATGTQVWAKHYPNTLPAASCPGGVAANCITTSSPAIDPNRHYVYAYGLDGLAHKLQVGDGVEISSGGWPEVITLKPGVEKQSSALAIATVAGVSYLYAANSAHNGDGGDAQGHLTTINLATGAQVVFNLVCSNLSGHFALSPGTPDCATHLAGGWARPGAVYDAGTGRIFVGTGNGTFNVANHNWGDSILALSPSGLGNGSSPVDAYTPTNQQALDNGDTDLGSTAPAILPVPLTSKVQHLAVQSGKDGMLRLLNLADLSGSGGPGNLGGEIGTIIAVPQGGAVRTQPAVWTSSKDGSTWVFVVNQNGSSGLQLTFDGSGNPSLVEQWKNVNTLAGASPLVANNVLYFANNNSLVGLDPLTGISKWNTSLIGGIHWQSPVVACSSIYVLDGSNQISSFGLSLGRSVVAAGNDQTVTVGTSFAAPLAVSVTNAAGALQSGTSVTFQIQSSAAGAVFPGSATSATATTNASGIATSPAITANTVAGDYTVTTTVAGAACPASFHLSNVVVSADQNAVATVLANPGAFNGIWPGFAFGLPNDVPMIMELGDTLIPLTYRGSSQLWYLDFAGFANFNAATTKAVQFGLPGDSPQIVRFAGVDHLAVYRPSANSVLMDTDNETYHSDNVQVLGKWSPLIPATVSQVVSDPESFDGTWHGFSFGLVGDTPLLIQLAAGGPKLPVVFRPAGASWYIDLAGYANYSAAQTQVVQFGFPDDVPEIVYWNGGDHIAVYRPSTLQTLVNTNNQTYSGNNVQILP